MKKNTILTIFCIELWFLVVFCSLTFRFSPRLSAILKGDLCLVPSIERGFDQGKIEFHGVTAEYPATGKLHLRK